MTERIERHSTGWYETLDAYVLQCATLPFVWGVHDCCTFAAEWVLIVRGVDPMTDLRGLDSALTAHRAIERLGGLLAAVDARMGAHIAGPFAQVGDVALVTLDSGHQACAVCVGPWLVAPGEDGLQYVPIDCAEATWRV